MNVGIMIHYCSIVVQYNYNKVIMSRGMGTIIIQGRHNIGIKVFGVRNNSDITKLI